MKTVMSVSSLVAPPNPGAVVAIYATTAVAATVKQYLIVAREAAWGLDAGKNMAIGMPFKTGAKT